MVAAGREAAEQDELTRNHPCFNLRPCFACVSKLLFLHPGVASKDKRKKQINMSIVNDHENSVPDESAVAIQNGFGNPSVCTFYRFPHRKLAMSRWPKTIMEAAAVYMSIGRVLSSSQIALVCDVLKFVKFQKPGTYGDQVNSTRNIRFKDSPELVQIGIAIYNTLAPCLFDLYSVQNRFYAINPTGSYDKDVWELTKRADMFILDFQDPAEPGSTAGLRMHRDEDCGAISFVIPILQQSDQRKDVDSHVGGTVYRNVLQKPNQYIETKVGELVCHAGDIIHCSSPVVNGRRVIIGGFLKPLQNIKGKDFSQCLNGDRSALKYWMEHEMK